ncbi:MAG: EamA family transporter [Ignavibacteriales bacterium]|nr:EamA family transporter [Ignavibacteriales bacterium]
MWILFALLNPVSEGFKSLFAKITSRDVEPIVLSWANNFVPFLFFTPFIFFIELKFNTNFFIGVSGSGIINLAATIIFMRAISKGDISEVMPMLSFTPLFLLVTSPIMVGEFPNTMGLIGVIIIVIGSYTLNIDLKGKNIFEPFKSLLKNKGTRYMLVVAFIWSISANFDKISITNSSVLQHIAFVNAFIFITLSIVLKAQKKNNWKLIFAKKNHLLAVSSFSAFSFIFHMLALSMTLVAYVVALKRLSGLISVFLGHIYLGEKNIKQRMVGATLMFTGVLLIVLSGSV